MKKNKLSLWFKKVLIFPGLVFLTSSLLSCEKNLSDNTSKIAASTNEDDEEQDQNHLGTNKIVKPAPILIFSKEIKDTNISSYKKEDFLKREFINKKVNVYELEKELGIKLIGRPYYYMLRMRINKSKNSQKVHISAADTNFNIIKTTIYFSKFFDEPLAYLEQLKKTLLMPISFLEKEVFKDKQLVNKELNLDTLFLELGINLDLGISQYKDNTQIVASKEKDSFKVKYDIKYLDKEISIEVVYIKFYEPKFRNQFSNVKWADFLNKNTLFFWKNNLPNNAFFAFIDWEKREINLPNAIKRIKIPEEISSPKSREYVLDQNLEHQLNIFSLDYELYNPHPYALNIFWKNNEGFARLKFSKTLHQYFLETYFLTKNVLPEMDDESLQYYFGPTYVKKINSKAFLLFFSNGQFIKIEYLNHLQEAKKSKNFKTKYYVNDTLENSVAFDNGKKVIINNYYDLGFAHKKLVYYFETHNDKLLSLNATVFDKKYNIIDSFMIEDFTHNPEPIFIKETDKINKNIKIITGPKRTLYLVTTFDYSSKIYKLDKDFKTSEILDLASLSETNGGKKETKIYKVFNYGKNLLIFNSDLKTAIISFTGQVIKPFTKFNVLDLFVCKSKEILAFKQVDNDTYLVFINLKFDLENKYKLFLLKSTGIEDTFVKHYLQF